MQKFSNRLRGVLTVTMKGFGFVDIPNHDDDIFVSKENLHGAVDGDTVTVRFTKPKSHGRPNAEVIRIDAHNTEVLNFDTILKTYNLQKEFPKRVTDEAARVAVLPDPNELKDRIDLRGKQIITIDPFDAKDLDDAVSLERNPDGTQVLGVHIADVSHYVREDSELDKEAFKRGTSVYFPYRVLPMLPPQLSNNICSLNPNQPRLTLSVFMTLDRNYNIIAHKIAKTIIQTAARFSYDEVQNILDGVAKSPHKAMLDEMAKITQIYERSRLQRGEIAFNVPEPKILLDGSGEISSVYAQPHTLSHRIIETFMILANEVVAQKFRNTKIGSRLGNGGEPSYKQEMQGERGVREGVWSTQMTDRTTKFNAAGRRLDDGVPFVYRTHDKPDPIKVLRFTKVLVPFNVRHNIDPENPTGRAYQNLLDNIEDENVKIIVSTLALRSMQKAKYSPDCTGHFGLGASYYCHFTSPIRRYPDLAIHRIIKLYLDGKLTPDKIEKLKSFVQNASEQSSKTEIDAMEAEREVDNMKRAEFMHKHIGDSFNGVVSGITEFGVFVYIPENTAEGLVRIENLPGSWKYDDDTMQMLQKSAAPVGDQSQIGRQKRIRMGDPITVTVTAVNLRKAKIEFGCGQ
jgi:ribonuclease R